MIKTESIKIVKESELSFFDTTFPSSIFFFFYSLLHNLIIFPPPPPPHSIVFYPSPTRFIFLSPRDSIKDCQLPSLVHFEAMSRGEKKMKRVGEGKKTIE